MSKRSVVIFDLGGVLIDWNPRHLYRKLFNGDAAGMEAFLTEVCHHDWNLQQDAGRSFAEAEKEAIVRHPDKEKLIRAWRARFEEMIPGALDDTVAILAELKERRTPLYALSNWSAETFPSQRPRFPFLEWFDGIVLSGEERVIKPDPRLYRVLLDRYAVAAADAVFIDDSKKNADAASALGIHGLHFTTAPVLRGELVALGLL